MGWKSLIFAGADSSEKKETKKEESSEVNQTISSNKFPSSVSTQNTFPNVSTNTTSSVNSTITPDNPMCAPHLDKIMTMYETGFNSLNQAGYDFFEYFKSVLEGGVNNPQVYTMAFTMGKAMEPKLTKELLLSQSEFYITEITKVHNSYVDAGNVKRQEAITAKANEENLLRIELVDIESEIKRLNELKGTKEAELSKIDNKYQPQITEIECKLMANDMAKDNIVNSINKVVGGINNNI